MHIEQVTIKNFRCFEHLEVKLNPDVNVFVGNNGSGKSALLDAIAAAMYPFVNPGKREYENSSSYSYARRKISSKLSPLFQRDLPVQLEAIESSLHRDIEFSVKLSAQPEIDVTFYDFPERGSRSHAKYITSGGEQSELLGNTQPDIPTDSYYLHVLAYYRSARDIRNIASAEKIPERRRSREDALINALDAASSFSDLANWFFSKEFQELGEARRRRDIDFELKDLRAVRRAVSAMIAPSSRIFFAHSGTETELKAEWSTTTGENKELWFSQLSSGYRNLLAIVMDFSRRLAQANPQMENPLEAESILLIDELDLHLHPKWQQRVILDLRKVFPNTQLIVTTHSPEVVTTVGQHQVFLLENHQIQDCPSPTRGMKSSEVVRYVLGLDNLRPETEEKQTLIQLFDAIDSGDIDAAKRFREELKSWESFDSDLTRADMQIRRMERRASA